MSRLFQVLQAQNLSEPAKLLPSAGSAPLIVINTDDSGPGALRQALLDANAHSGPDSIRFAIPDSDPGFAMTSGVWIIRPQSALPEITDDGTVIDGLTQKDVSDQNPDGPEIMIDGSTDPSLAAGFKITSANNAISGLVISGFKDCGVRMSGSDAKNNWITGNYIGTNTSGNGVLISDHAKHNVIGGSEPLQGNVISGNYYNGCYITSDSTISDHTIAKIVKSRCDKDALVLQSRR